MFLSNIGIPADKAGAYIGNDPVKTVDIPCRDPFIMLVGDTYYLYKSTMSEMWNSGKPVSKNIDIICYKSKDLENWCDPVTVLEGKNVEHGIKDMFWAPECHYYNGSFYIFTSVYSSLTDHRSISVYRASSPEGPFTDITGGYITPKGMDAIDGTLYVDESGVPYMVFVNEWTNYDNRTGKMSFARLSDDLTHFVTKPQDIFTAREPKWAKKGVTDGPYLYRNDDGRLLMIWSNFGEKGYAVALAESESGKIEGPWKHCDQPLYERGYIDGLDYDGGHAMLFEDVNGKLRITFHAPNKKTDTEFEHPVICEIIEKNSKLCLIRY